MTTNVWLTQVGDNYFLRFYFVFCAFSVAEFWIDDFIGGHLKLYTIHTFPVKNLFLFPFYRVAQLKWYQLLQAKTPVGTTLVGPPCMFIVHT